LTYIPQVEDTIWREYLQPLPDCFRVNVKQFRNIFETAMAQLVRLHSRIPTSVLLRQPHVQLLHPRFNLSPITSLHRLSSRMTASYQRRFAPARSTSGSYFSLVPKAQGNDTASGDWSFVSAVDGQKQWAYKGHPLYRFAKDTQPGQANGDGVKGVWHTAKP
jgi:hypothetical protein